MENQFTNQSQPANPAGQSQFQAPPQAQPKSKDGLLAIIVFYAFGYYFINTIISSFGLGYGAAGRITGFLGLGIYAIPLILSFVIQKKGLKVTTLIFGIITLVFGLWNYIYYSFLAYSLYGY